MARRNYFWCGTGRSGRTAGRVGNAADADADGASGDAAGVVLAIGSTAAVGRWWPCAVNIRACTPNK